MYCRVLSETLVLGTNVGLWWLLVKVSFKSCGHFVWQAVLEFRAEMSDHGQLLIPYFFKSEFHVKYKQSTIGVQLENLRILAEKIKDAYI